MKNIDQVFRIKRILAERGETVASMARKLDLPAGSVAGNVYGFRSNPDTQEAIAGFLGRPVKQVFAGAAPEGREACNGLEAQHTRNIAVGP